MSGLVRLRAGTGVRLHREAGDAPRDASQAAYDDLRRVWAAVMGDRSRRDDAASREGATRGRFA